MNKVRIIAATVAASAVLSGCATGPNRNPNDPLEPMNRAMYKFNDTVDTNIAVPIAKGYQKITPTPQSGPQHDMPSGKIKRLGLHFGGREALNAYVRELVKRVQTSQPAMTA